MRGLVVPERTDDFTADPVELFFDLAYVFAFSQLVKLLLDDPTWSGVGHAAILFLLLWLPWTQFTWSANAVSGNSRTVRVLFLLATAASVPMAASITTALDSGGFLFAIPMTVIFLSALALMVAGLEAGSEEYRSSLRYSRPNIVAMAFILLGAFFDDQLRIGLWITGIVIFVIATLRAGSDEWIVRTGHFAERHGLIIIVALGEVIVALGNSVVVPLTEDGRVERSTVLSLVAAGALAGMLWWSYFDRVQPAFEHRAEQLAGNPRARFVRDVYTYAHFPVVAGVVLIAVALEEMTLHPTDPMPWAFRLMGAAGFVLFFGGIGLGVLRSFRVIALERLVAVAVIVVLLMVADDVDGVVLMVMIDAVILVALVTEHLRIERPHSRSMTGNATAG